MEQKLCSRCKVPKSIEEFRWKNKKAKKRQSQCSACMKVFQADWYKRNKVSAVARAYKNRTRVRKEVRQKVWKYLKDHPCVDCGETDIVVLTFDHNDGSDKTYDVSAMIRNGYTWETVKAEIAKCSVRCANCHTRRTAKQFGWTKLFAAVG